MSTPTDPRRGDGSPDQGARDPAGDQGTARSRQDDAQAGRLPSGEPVPELPAHAGQPPREGYGPSAQDQPVQDQPARDQPVKDQPVRDQPAQDQPAQDQPAQDQSAQDQSARDRPALDRPAQYDPDGQPGQYGTPSQYPQPGQYAQPDPYGQPSQYPQPGQYGQPSQYPQPGQYGPAGTYDQGAYSQSGPYGTGQYGTGPYGGQPAGADQGQYAYSPYGTPYPAGLGETGVHAVPRPGIMVLSLVLLILAALPFLAVATVLLAVPLDSSLIPPGFDLEGQLAEAGVTFETLVSFLRILAAIMLVLALLYIVFAITAFTGRNWARVVLTIMTLGFALLLVAGLATGGAIDSASLTFILLVLVAAVGGTVLLYLPDVNRFFASPRR